MKNEKLKEDTLDLSDSKRFLVDYSKKRKLTDIKGMIKEYKFNQNTSKAFLINMFMVNNTKESFIVFPFDDNSFVYKRKRYIIDENYMFYDTTTRNWGLHYHESLTLPIDIKISVGDVKEKLKTSQSYEVETAINPNLLEIYMKSSFVEKIMKGEEMDKLFKRLILLGMVSAIGIVVTLFILIKTTGVLDNLI